MAKRTVVHHLDTGDDIFILRRDIVQRPKLYKDVEDPDPTNPTPAIFAYTEHSGMSGGTERHVYTKNKTGKGYTASTTFVEVTKVCNYCHRKYTTGACGDFNLGACNRPRCILQSMRDHC